MVCYIFSFKIVSIHDKSKFSKYKINTLINLKKIDRSIIDPRLVLCYSVSGTIFDQLKLIVQKIQVKFKYFTNTKLDKKIYQKYRII